jgi:hypothetical protein
VKPGCVCSLPSMHREGLCLPEVYGCGFLHTCCLPECVYHFVCMYAGEPLTAGVSSRTSSSGAYVDFRYVQVCVACNMLGGACFCLHCPHTVCKLLAAHKHCSQLVEMRQCMASRRSWAGRPGVASLTDTNLQDCCPTVYISPRPLFVSFTWPAGPCPPGQPAGVHLQRRYICGDWLWPRVAVSAPPMAVPMCMPCDV